MNLYYIFSYLIHKLKARNFKGHGIHSPFVFELVTKVLLKKTDSLQNNLRVFCNNYKLHLEYIDLKNGIANSNTFDNNTLYIIKEIHNSKKNNEFWKQLKNNNKTIVSIDMFKYGVIITNYEITKGHFVV